MKRRGVKRLVHIYVSVHNANESDRRTLNARAQLMFTMPTMENEWFVCLLSPSARFVGRAVHHRDFVAKWT
jgi:hypothetical protein